MNRTTVPTSGAKWSRYRFPTFNVPFMFRRMPNPSHPPRLRLPAFHPVPVRTRADGWTPLKQAEFIGMLTETGSVAAAAAFVGMARETAYRLRRKPGAEEFAQAWDVALVVAGVRQPGEQPRSRRPRKVTHEPTWRMIVDGCWRPVLRNGKYAGSIKKADNSALLGYLAQLDRSFRATRKDLRRELRSQAEKRDPASTPTGRPGGNEG
jgi:hypothetical protein